MVRRLRTVAAAGALAAAITVAGADVVGASSWCDGSGELVSVADNPRARHIDRKGNDNGMACRYEWWIPGHTKTHAGFYDDTIA